MTREPRAIHPARVMCGHPPQREELKGVSTGRMAGGIQRTATVRPARQLIATITTATERDGQI